MCNVDYVHILKRFCVKISQSNSFCAHIPMHIFNFTHSYAHIHMETFKYIYSNTYIHVYICWCIHKIRVGVGNRGLIFYAMYIVCIHLYTPIVKNNTKVPVFNLKASNAAKYNGKLVRRSWNI